MKCLGNVTVEDIKTVTSKAEIEVEVIGNTNE